MCWKCDNPNGTNDDYLDELRQMMDDGTFLTPAMHIDYQDRFLIEVVEVEHPDVHLKFAVGICGPDVRALQLVWADDRGRWPWDAGWGHGRRRQPVLGVRTPL
jgi:hypothetical protein